MNRRGIWALPLLLAVGAIGCGDATVTNADAGASVLDLPASRDVTAPPDTPMPPMAGTCANPVDLSTILPDPFGLVQFNADNQLANDAMLGALPAGCVNGAKGAAMVFRYRMHSDAALRVSTDNAGTNFDTVVAVLSTCSSAAPTLACNDDGAAVTMLRTNSLAVTAPLGAGREVFIVVGGWAPPMADASRGMFALSIAELVAGRSGGPCRVAPMTPCEGGLTCSVMTPTPTAPGTCGEITAPPMPGAPCTSDASCPPNSTCRVIVRGAPGRVCIANGALAGLCRTTPGTMPCDSGLACGRVTPVSTVGFCRPAVMLGAACDPSSFENACADGFCVRDVPSDLTSTAATCRETGGVGGYCRTTEPRCNADLRCSGITPLSVCVATLALGAACPTTSASAVCPAGAACVGIGSVGACAATSAEVEPNPREAPQVITGTVAGIVGELPAGDVDCFRVAVPAGGSLRAQTSDGHGACPFPPPPGTLPYNTVLTVYAPGGEAPIATYDTGGSLSCSLLDPATTPTLRGLAAGDYTVCASLAGASPASPAYTITLAVGAP